MGREMLEFLYNNFCCNKKRFLIPNQNRLIIYLTFLLLKAIVTFIIILFTNYFVLNIEISKNQ